MMNHDTIARLYVLDFGLFQVNANNRIIGIQGYLLQTHDGKNILVDTGFPGKYADDVEKASAEDDLGGFGHVLTLTHDNLPEAQLAKCGLMPADIDMLIMTHTHIDHVGGIGDFPHAPIVISRIERDLPTPLYWNNRSPIEWPDAEYQLIDGDCELVPGIRLLETPGHAPGHLSLLVKLPKTGAVLLTADAISRPEEIDEKYAGSWNPELALASAERLMAIAQAEDAFVLYGHSPEQWGELKKAPEFYA